MLIFQMNMTLSLNLKPLLWISPFFTRHSSAPQLITKIHLQREPEPSLRGLEPPVYQFVHTGMNPAVILPQNKPVPFAALGTGGSSTCEGGWRRAGLPKGRVWGEGFPVPSSGSSELMEPVWVLSWACSPSCHAHCWASEHLTVWWGDLWAPWRQPSTCSHRTSVFCSLLLCTERILFSKSLSTTAIAEGDSQLFCKQSRALHLI